MQSVVASLDPTRHKPSISRDADESKPVLVGQVAQRATENLSHALGSVGLVHDLSSLRHFLQNTLPLIRSALG